MTGSRNPVKDDPAKAITHTGKPAELKFLANLCRSGTIWPMRHLLILIATITALPLSSWAADPMGAEEFDRYTLGKTLFYGFEGNAYGVERYLPGRRVLWSFLDGQCKTGHWYEEAGQICFVYENNSVPQCWSFVLTPKGLNARFQNDPLETELYEAGDTEEEMLCLGPEVGV